MTIACLYPIFVRKRGPAYACQSLLEAMQRAGQPVRLYCVSAEREMARSYHRCVMPQWGQRLWFRLLSEEMLYRQVEWRFGRGIAKGDLAYIWPGTSVGIHKRVRALGHAIVAESINTHMATSKVILDAEYARLGLAPSHGITDDMIAAERAKLELVDLVFSPSDQVTKSLCHAGIAEDRIIQTSYGLEETDVLGREEFDARHFDGRLPVAIFVGRIGIRKGAHLLLEYWVKARVRGKLRLVGNIDADARHIVEPYLDRPDVEHVPFTFDLNSVYRDADLFIFPSLEEGSPLVTNLALGAGLPSLVSPMGAGGVIRDGVDGMIIDPHDADGWISAIRQLFDDGGLRQRMGSSAHARARHYLWSEVGRRRLEALRSAPALRGCSFR